MPRRAVEKKGNRMDGEDNPSFLSSHEASEHVILSAEGAKDLLLEVGRGITNG